MKNAKHSRFVLAAAFAALSGVSARADIIVDHQPHPYGGPGSDTSYLSPFGQPLWQRVADDFTLGDSNQAIALNFWGFYNADNPPPTETMRVRIYGARAGDGLPDDANILSETTVQDPVRINTGRRIQTGIGPYEYRFEASLAAPVSLASDTPYWLEVVQIGDITTHFRWEDSVSELGGFAFMNQGTGGDWRSSLPGADYGLAFQLISPEPASLVLLGTGLFWLMRRR